MLLAKTYSVQFCQNFNKLFGFTTDEWLAQRGVIKPFEDVKPACVKSGTWEIAHLRRISLPSVGRTFQTIFKPACDPVAQVTKI